MKSRMSGRGGSLRRTRACRPALARKACSSTLVGLLTPRLSRLHAFSRWPHRNADRNGLETAGLGAWSQRRGRPGFSPEFPVCRRQATARPGHQSRGRQCIGGPGHVKQNECPAWVRNCAGRAKTQAENVTIVRARAAQFMHVKPTALFAQRAAVSRVSKNTWRHSSRFHPAADSPSVPRGNHCARRATRGRQQPEMLRVTEWLDRPAAESSWITSSG